MIYIDPKDLIDLGIWCAGALGMYIIYLILKKVLKK
jgi:hypothetical protein